MVFKDDSKNYYSTILLGIHVHILDI